MTIVNTLKRELMRQTSGTCSEAFLHSNGIEASSEECIVCKVSFENMLPNFNEHIL